MALFQPFKKILLTESLLVLLLVGSPLILLAQDKHINLTIYDNGTVYKMGFTNSECPGRPQELGCIEADWNNSPMISWELDAASNREWELTRLQFSPDGQYWGDPGYPLADCTMDDFALIDADRYSGNASTAKIVANGRRMQIRDHNRNLCSTHYKLFARPRSGGAEINSDPVIENRGRN